MNQRFTIVLGVALVGVLVVPPLKSTSAQERGRGLQNLLRAGGEALRGIEKKDIRRGTVLRDTSGSAARDFRVVILYDGDETPDAVAQAVSSGAPTEKIASSAKLTKADAARTVGGPADGIAGPPITFLAAKQNAEEDCSKPGCFNTEAGCFCFRLLDIDKVVLQDIVSDDPEFHPPRKFSQGSSTGSTGGRMAAPPRTVIIVLGESLQTKLTSPNWWKRNHGWFQQEVASKMSSSPLTTNLVIKTKSPPP